MYCRRPQNQQSLEEDEAVAAAALVAASPSPVASPAKTVVTLVVPELRPQAEPQQMWQASVAQAGPLQQMAMVQSSWWPVAPAAGTAPVAPAAQVEPVAGAAEWTPAVEQEVRLLSLGPGGCVAYVVAWRRVGRRALIGWPERKQSTASGVERAQSVLR